MMDGAGVGESAPDERQAGLALLERLESHPALAEVAPDLRAVFRQTLDREPPLRVLQVLANDIEVGWLVDANDIWLFQYSPYWAAHPDAFDLSPVLSRVQLTHLDRSTLRPVQWFFDNLLPEEELRQVLATEARLEAADAFGLLRYYGAESAGALVLRPVGAPAAEPGLRELTPEALHQRILDLPRAPLTKEAPKRMSLAGAQHKMVLVVAEGVLYEPLPGTPSTHILKPNSLSPHYPATVINEYFAMRLARKLGLAVPEVRRIYVPEPAYIVARFDRTAGSLDPDAGSAQVNRRHAIDTCQLLGTSRVFKYEQASLETLATALERVRSRAPARRQLFMWLVFNVLIGNADNHLKNLSFIVSPLGVELAPAYDLLSTAVYDTRGYAGERAAWPHTPLALPIPGATTFAQVTRDGLIEAGVALGLGRPMAQRVLGAMLQSVEARTTQLLAEIDAQYDRRRPEGVFSAALANDVTKGAERNLLRAIWHIVIRDMLVQLAEA